MLRNRSVLPQDLLYGGLGLGEADLSGHIAWDIGAAMVARDLARRLDAPLILAVHSRLLIDLNRPVDSPTSIPTVSESTAIPGNVSLDDAERQSRIAAYFMPFQRAVSGLLDKRQRAGRPTRVIGIHSFTPVY